MQEIILPELVCYDNLLAGSRLCGECHGGVGHLRRCEEELRSIDVLFLSFKHVLQLLVFSLKESDVAVSILVLEILYDSLAYHSTLSGECQFELAVLELYVLSLALESLVEQGHCVAGSEFLGLLCGYCCRLFLVFCFQFLDFRDGVLSCSLGNLLCRWLVVPSESYEQCRNKHKSCDSVFVHCYIFVLRFYCCVRFIWFLFWGFCFLFLYFCYL